MTCKGNCNQGRECTCQPDRNVDRAIFDVAPVLIIIILISCIGMGSFMVYDLFTNITSGQECAVTLQFNNNVKATYIGKTV